MPDERLITQIENILADVVQLGGANERTSIVPNLTVQDANPTGIDGFVIVSDDRDGDNILAKKLGSVVYSDGDQVNVLFVEGGEAIAYQQGSESTNSGIWEIVPSTSTDISYDKGDVGIGKSVAPDAALEVLDTSQAQLRLSHTEDTKFIDFTLDTNHDLTIKPSSTGQIKLQPTSDSVDFFQVLDADGGTPVFNVDTVNERVGIGTASPGEQLEVSGNLTIAGSANDFMLERTGKLQFVATGFGNRAYITSSGTNEVVIVTGSSTTAGTFGPSTLLTIGAGTASVTSKLFINNNAATTYGFTTETGSGGRGFRVITPDFVASTTGSVLNMNMGAGSGNTDAIIDAFTQGTAAAGDLILQSVSGGDVGIGLTAPAAKLHIDQASTTAALPTLSLDQADLSEEFVNFISTIGAGNPIDTAAIGTYYGKIRVAVNGTFKFMALYNS